MSRRQCCVWGCHNRKGRCPEDIKGDRVCGCPDLRATGCPRSGELLSLHYIKKMPDQVMKLTVSKINKTRQSSRGRLWVPSDESCICNMHYEGFRGPTRWNNCIVPQYFKRPHDFYEHRSVERRILVRRTPEPAEAPDEPPDESEMPTIVCDATTQSDDSYTQELLSLKERNVQLLNEVRRLQSTLQSLDPVLLSSSQLYTYTGMNACEFQCFTSWLTGTSLSRRSMSPDDSRTLTFSQKLLMVLMRIRQNLTQDDLACRFAVDQSSVSRIINHWVPMLSAVLSDLITWPQTTIGPNHPPYNFLPNSVAIIDGTEMFIQRPSNLSTQKSSYSDYKSHTTVKYLVAIDTFTGVFVFVSPGFSGNSSDRFTIEKSGILDVLKPGQRILADKGYTARDLFARKRCFLTIPSFLTGGRFSGHEALESRTVASVRIRVENAIRRLKEYRIFSGTLCNRLNKKLIDDMVIVTCALCNLKNRLIK